MKKKVNFEQKLKEEHAKIVSLNVRYRQQKLSLDDRMLLILELSGMSAVQANKVLGTKFFNEPSE